MARDLFGDVVDPSIKLGTRKWYTVPVSFLVHTIVIGALIVVPLLATGALPLPVDATIFVAVEPPELPQPPPVRAATPSPVHAPVSTAAPAVAPDSIRDETPFEPGFEAASGVAVPIGGSEVDGGAVVAPPPAVVAPPPSKPVRPGGEIRAPERVTYVAPVYPPVALAARVQGLVIIEATIDATGEVQDARVLRSDSPLLNEAALNAARKWLYRPTLLNGVPVSVIMTVTVQFRLQ